MSIEMPPTERMKYDLASTFNVLVGKAETSQRFMLHTNVFIPRFEFFRAARSSQWLSDPQKPVDLEDKDVEIFPLYTNCVYFRVEVLQVDALDNDLNKQVEEDNGKEESFMVLEDNFDSPEEERVVAMNSIKDDRAQIFDQAEQQIETLSSCTWSLISFKMLRPVSL